jgi:single stranded DNA-binding protein
LLLGTVGSDPETKIISESARVSTFRLATNETFTGKDGVKKELTEWHSVEAWNFLSDTIANYVKKGAHIIIKGKIKTDSYDDKEVAGRKLSRTKIVMDKIHFLPGNKNPERQNGQSVPQQQAIPQQQPVYPNQPVYQQQPPVQQAPVYQQPPVQQQQAPIQQAPIQQAPVQQAPVQQAPVQQAPVQQAPVQQAPVYQQPPVQQQYQPPVQQPPINQQPPVQQAQQQINTYMTDEQFINGMSSPDDLPF